MKLAEDTASGLLILHTAASRVGAMDVGAATEGGLAAAVEGADVIYNLGADEVDIAPGAFVIYQGSHGDRGAHRADVILPAAAYPEEAGLFVNTEGRPQLAFRASFPPGEARENWAILRALSAEIGATQPWNNIGQLRRALVDAVPHLGAIDAVPVNDVAGVAGRAAGHRPTSPRSRRPLPREPDRPGEHADGGAERGRQGARRGADGGGVDGLGHAGRCGLLSRKRARQRCCWPLASRARCRRPPEPLPRHEGVETRLIDDDIVNLIVRMSGPATQGDLIAYSRCAAAQYAVIRGYGFARHVRTNVQVEGSVRVADAVYTVSPTLPRGLQTIDAEVTVADCAELGIPTV
jgi:hypothetical protein